MATSEKKFEIHMHSTFSDGELAPQALVNLALRNGVSVLSLTDHDTFAGTKEFLDAAQKAEIFAFPGIEITVRYRDVNLHLLGYFKSLDTISSELHQRVVRMKTQRDERMKEMIGRLNQVIPKNFKNSILFENVSKACEGVVGRPHLAKEMVRLKIVSTPREAFEKYLIRYNIEKKNILIEEALEFIRACGGISVLAHPGERNYSLLNPAKGRPAEKVASMVDELKTMGLMGLECICPYHEKTGKVDFFLELTRRYGLIATGSRDFHGKVTNQNPEVLGNTSMKPVFLEQFQEKWS